MYPDVWYNTQGSWALREYCWGDPRTFRPSGTNKVLDGYSTLPPSTPPHSDCLYPTHDSESQGGGSCWSSWSNC